MVLWRAPGSDVTGMVCRCEKIVTTAEKVKMCVMYEREEGINSIKVDNSDGS
jgi:hypothetical protein